MQDIFSYHWTSQRRSNLILEILSGFSTIQMTTQKHNISYVNLQEWCNEISPNLAPNFKKLAENPPQNICWKDINLSFQGCSTNLAKIMGLRTPKDIIGLRAKDICYKAADLYEADEKLAIHSGNILDVTCTLYYQTNHEYITTVKVVPLFNENGSPYGVFCMGELKNKFCINNYEEFVTLINGKTLPCILRDKKFLITYNNQLIYLSRKETVCLLFLMKGTPLKQVANEIGISYRTVINYLENIKSKIGVSSKTELLTLTFLSDFLKNIGIYLLYN